MSPSEPDRVQVMLVGRVERWRWQCPTCGAERATYTTGAGAHEGGRRHGREFHGDERGTEFVRVER